MKIIKRRTQVSYKPISDLEWQKAYTRYLEMCIARPSNIEKFTSLEDFKMFAATIWRPIPEIDEPIETEEQFVQRMTKADKKMEYVNLQFVWNDRGHVVSCIMY